jgi:PadR family transcriptional regulator, regulatory protein PadR
VSACALIVNRFRNRSCPEARCHPGPHVLSEEQLLQLHVPEIDIGAFDGYAGSMSSPKVRMTHVIEDIFGVLISASASDPAWGLRICHMTEHGTGTVYPALDRLLRAGLIEARWEDPAPKDRPKRRYYEITSSGREWLADAVRTQDVRRARWLGNAWPGAASCSP